jgi:5-hydroxyisourate hydrolase-like protein (transthyretin family)
VPHRLIRTIALSATLCLAAGVLAASQAAAVATDVPPPPAGAEHVPVTAGHTTDDVDVALHPHVAADQSISGHVTDATTGDPIFGIAVPVYLHGHEVTHGVTDPNGNYTVTDLAPSTTGYAVCFGARYDPEDPDGGGEPYAGKCLGGGPWIIDGARPDNLVRVPLAAHEHRTGVDAALDPEAVIAGRVTRPNGHGAANVTVIARSISDANVVARINTMPSGGYHLHNLPAASDGYEVCFNGANSGEQRGCYRHVHWGHGPMPATATPVSVSSGHTHGGIDAELAVGGSLDARVVSARTGKPIELVDVSLFNAAGTAVAFARTDDNGRVSWHGLFSGGHYHLCAQPEVGLARLGAASYHSACYRHSAWDGSGPPVGATDIRIRPGAGTGRLKISLPDAATLDGVVRTADGDRLVNAAVEVFDAAGRELQPLPNQQALSATNRNGHYHFVGLPASKRGYVVCARDIETQQAATPGGRTGYAPRCTGNTRWTGSAEAVPQGAKHTPLGAHESRAGVDLRLPVGGEIAGKVTDASSGHALFGASITLFDHSGHVVTEGDSRQSESGFRFTGLAASSGYYVCVAGGLFAGVGFFDGQCYGNVPWSGVKPN